MEKRRVILDMDTGVDDALAMMLAAASDRIEIVALTTVFGNNAVDATTENTLKMCEFLGIDAPVARGAAHRLLKDYARKESEIGLDIHGADGLGNMSARLPVPKRKVEGCTAAELMARAVEQSEGPVTIVSTAPITNVATFLLAYPRLKSKVECVAFMGGAMFGGNIMPSAEANTFNDPDALQVVLQSGVKVVMFGLDVTMKCVISSEKQKELSQTGRVGEFAAAVLQHYIDVTRQLTGIDGAMLHDSLPVAWLEDESVVKLEKHYVEVDLDGAFTCGCTVTDINDTLGREPNVYVAVRADSDRIIDMHLEAARRLG